MRSKLLLAAAVMMVGCSDDEPTSPVVVEDATAETIGIDVSVDTGRPVETGTDSATTDSGAADSGAADSATDSAADSRMDTADTATADTATADSRADSVATDTAPDAADTALDATDTALDALDTSVTDAAFATAPTCDGTIGAAEYGVHTEGRNQYSNTGTTNTWYMTWDDTSLYIAIANANPSEGAVIYIDANPLTPATSGGDAAGNLAGFDHYDNTRFTAMPFRANLVAYAKSDYREYRTSDGEGRWSTPTTAFGCFASAGTSRELSIPWSALGGRPASFGVLGYVTSSGGFVYGEIPMANPEGNIGKTATATKYFHVGSTGPAATTNAFADER